MDSVVDSDAEFDAALRSTNDVIGDVTAADAADTVISAEQVISEIECMLEVCSIWLLCVCAVAKCSRKRFVSFNMVMQIHYFDEVRNIYYYFVANCCEKSSVS